MIAIPAMKMCENEPIAHCGLNVFWDKRMIAVKSGRFEKHRNVYLLKKKKKDNHTYVKFHTAPACTPGNLHGGGSYGALRVESQTWAGVTFSLLVSSALVNIRVFILHLWLLVGHSTTHRRTQGFVLSFFEASGCTLAGLSVFPYVLPPKMKHIPVTTRREVSTCLLSSSCRKCHCTLLSIWQLFPIYSPWCVY